MENKKLTIILGIIVVLGLCAVYINEEYQGIDELSYFFGSDSSAKEIEIYVPPPEDSSSEEVPAEESDSAEDPVPSIGGYGVSAEHPLAVEVGMEVLRHGGNAVDAAVAVSYVLNVVEPYGSGIGGGGTMLIHSPMEEPIAYNYREIASYTEDNDHLGIGVPGFVKGLEEIHVEWGSMSMEHLIQPGIDLAENGVQVSALLENRLERAQYRMPVNQLPHLYPNERPVRAGTELKQPELANSLRMIQSEGAEGFYEGELAQLIAQQVDSITLEDLARYEIESSAPVQGQFMDYEVLSAPAPMSGITLIQALQITERIGIDQFELDSPDFVQGLAEAIRISYQDRVEQIGDPRFVYEDEEEAVTQLTSLERSDRLSEAVHIGHVSERVDVPFEDKETDGMDTTHFVIVDNHGMMVSATNTLSNFFGSGFYVVDNQGLGGFFMNDQLTNFAADAASPNLEQPGKRPRSFIAPTILSQDGKPVMGLGSPGGNRIPAMLSEVITRWAVFDQPLKDAIESPRFFYEWSRGSDHLYVETDLPGSTVRQLRERGYEVNVYDSIFSYGNISTIVIDYGDHDSEDVNLEAVGDSRRDTDGQIEMIQSGTE